jgi:glycosyltransferase involved in cell wall biosynthesis
MGIPVSVSVVIPAFNSADTLARAIDSARAQVYASDEIIVVDDGSADATRDIAKGYGGELRVICLPKRRGAAGARNVGIAAASCEAVAFLDADDEWLPQKLQAQVEVLNSSPRVSFVACAANLIARNGVDLGDLYRGHPVVTGPESWRALLAYNFVATPTVLVWKRHITAVGGFDEGLKIGEDQDLWIRLALAGDLGYVPQSLVRVYTRENSLSAQEFSDQLTYTLPMIERHISALRGRLSNAEIQHIMGKRLGLVGRIAYLRGDYRNGLRLIGRSMKLGYQPLGSLSYMALASPPAMWLKRQLGSNEQKPPKPGAVGYTKNAMLPADTQACVRFTGDFKPRLLVIVDAEEEFDWHQPFSRKNTQVNSIRAQGAAEKILQRFGISPTYVVDYPVASQEISYKPLKELFQAGRCQIGAQLHTWVTPPYEEEVSEVNSYANNLPAVLERRKVHKLTEIIERNFGCRPLVYRAGRYGAGSATLRILEELGYRVDCSVLPGPSHQLGAPDYCGGDSEPYWLNARRSVLEIPVTIGTVGLAGKYSEHLHRRIASPFGFRLKAPAVAARLGIAERIRLTPEGSTVEGSKILTRTMLRDGKRVFVVSYHSPSLEPGHTPYVRDHRDLTTFLRWLEDFFEFFMTEIGGIPSTPSEIYERALELDAVR